MEKGYKVILSVNEFVKEDGQVKWTDIVREQVICTEGSLERAEGAFDMCDTMLEGIKQK